MSMDIGENMKITDPGDPTPELLAAFELPGGCVSAKYVNNMREVVAYDILSDQYIVRYDYLDAAGNKVGIFMPKIDRLADKTVEQHLAPRRIEAAAVREGRA